ncbi:MAG: PolC-type DNA polymerase III [Ruminococcaceae bacterium]|nr:PolC-type DNA polymerase III [Oscillospiraceae bacterium]
MSTPFLRIFKNFHPEGQILDAAEALLVETMTGDRHSRSITVTVTTEKPMSRATVRTIEAAILDLYGLEQFSITRAVKTEVLTEDCLPALFRELKAAYPATNGFLDGARGIIDRPGHALTVELRGEGGDFLTNAGVGRALEQILSERYQERLNVTFRDGSTEDSAFDKNAVLEQVMKEAAENAPPPPPKKQESAPAATTEDGVLFGKRGKDAPAQIGDLNLDYGYVTVTGDIFSTAHKTITTKARENVPSKELGIMSFDMTDYTGSIRVSRSIDVKKAEEIFGAIKTGDTVTVQGKLIYNNFEKEMILNPSCILRATREERQDTAERKRVELHLHTNMSMMDGVSSASALVKQAAKWGHPAIAITDHGVAQAFPEAMNAAGKAGIKVIYGVEAYYVNDAGGAVDGLQRQSLDDEVVVFDIETTGFKPATEAIIEIGAVKIRNGDIIDRFSEFVNPKKPIPANITELTGISDDMVADAKPIEDVLPRFLDFVGNCPLSAHNASFDVGFINYDCAKLGIQREFTSIDTLTLARALLPQERHHKLDDVARALDLGDFNHHRACDDAEVTGRILLKFFAQLKQMGVQGIENINDAIRDLSSGGKVHYNHLIILVKNYVGLKNLYKLISEAHLNYYSRKRPIVPRSVLNRYREGLIIGSACEAGELFRAIVAKKSWNELKRIAEYYDYLEIQPIGNNMFMLRDGTARDEQELREFNETIVKLGQSLNKPVVATGDVHFLHPRDEVFRRILMAGQGFSDADNQAPLYFKPTQEMLAEFSYLGAQKAFEVVVENPNKIAEMCEEIRPVPKGTYPPSIDHSAEDLQEICYTNAKRLYGDPLPDSIVERIEAELKPIINNGFDVMYMSAQKLIKKSNDAGYLVGSRGSVGSSVVAYFCGISEVNPLPSHYHCPECHYLEYGDSDKYGCGADMPDQECPICHIKLQKDGFNIPFFTFLGFKAEKEPDIDLNFSGEYQTQAHRDCVELFGEGQVFKAGTIGTIADKTAYGYVRKYAEERNMVLSKAEINRLTIGCTGVKRTTGQHPGGLIVVPRDRTIYEFCPVQHPADDPNSTIITTHFDFHSIHDNLLKLDMLGHDNPTIIKHLEDMTGVSATTIPLDDPHTVGIFSHISHLSDVNGKPLEPDEILGTTGVVAVPEFGTRFARQMLIDTQPKNFDGLVRISGLSHGTDVWMGNAADLIKAGTATLNEVISARDDITMYLIAKGMDASLSFKTSEAIRKGKGIVEETVEIMKQCGVPEWYIESCQKIKYLYPKAHAVAYVMMAFRIAWYKVHRPLPFYSAYFSIRAVGFDANTMTHGIDRVKALYQELSTKPDATANEKDTVVTLEVVYEYYLRGFTFQPVDIYRSAAADFLIDGNALIPPLTALPGLGLMAAQDIVRERENGEFSSAEDLSLRCQKVSKAVIEILDNAGALESLPKSDQISMFDL